MMLTKMRVAATLAIVLAVVPIIEEPVREGDYPYEGTPGHPRRRGSDALHTEGRE